MSVLTVHENVDRPAGHRGRAGRTAVERVLGLLRRVFDAVTRSRQRHVNEDIARYLHQSGGRLTDEIEREMMQQLTRNWNFRP
jgi:hypothetical protein